MKRLYDLTTRIFRRVNNLYLHWLKHKDGKCNQLDDYFHNYCPAHAGIIPKQIKKHNQDKSVEEHFDIEENSLRDTDQIFFVPDKNTKDITEVSYTKSGHFPDRFYPINDRD